MQPRPEVMITRRHRLQDMQRAGYRSPPNQRLAKSGSRMNGRLMETASILFNALAVRSGSRRPSTEINGQETACLIIRA